MDLQRMTIGMVMTKTIGMAMTKTIGMAMTITIGMVMNKRIGEYPDGQSGRRTPTPGLITGTI